MNIAVFLDFVHKNPQKPKATTGTFKICSLEYLAAILLSFPELTEEVMRHLLFDLLEPGEEKKIYKRIRENYNHQEGLSSETIFKELSEKEAEKWRILAVYAEEKNGTFSDEVRKKETIKIVQSINSELISKKNEIPWSSSQRKRSRSAHNSLANERTDQTPSKISPPIMAKKNATFIRQPTEEELSKFPPSIRKLVKKGREHGFVTQQELMKAMPEAEHNVILLDDIYTLFMELGIEVIDVREDLIWKKKQEEKAAKKEKKKKSKKDENSLSTIMREDRHGLMEEEIEEDFEALEKHGERRRWRRRKRGRRCHDRRRKTAHARSFRNCKRLGSHVSFGNRSGSTLNRR
jgi:hypothetical protein